MDAVACSIRTLENRIFRSRSISFGTCIQHTDLYDGNMSRNPSVTRAKILRAADKLFYGEGLHRVGVDLIAATAGITKRTLYYHFSSKDELMAAYLEAKDEPTLEMYRRWFEDQSGSCADRIAAMFRWVAQSAENPRWKGCNFARAAAELAGMPGHPALAVSSHHKRRFEGWLENMLRADHLAEAALIARQLIVLLDGAIAHTLIHRDPAYAWAAGQAAVVLLGQAQRMPKSKDHEASRGQGVRSEPCLITT